MMKTLMVAVAVAVMAPAVALACDGNMNASAPAAMKKMTIAEVAKAKDVKAVDANTPEFRALKGTIPGAVLLTSASSFDPAKELPAQKDARLVFYCANNHCMASDGAARRAIEAGYTNVAVLPDGIEGWRAAGQKTASVKPNS